MRKDVFTAALLPLAAAGRLLYATSFAGTLTTLNFSLPSGNNAGAGTLEAISSTLECAPHPTWMTLDVPNSLLFCADEGFDQPSGSVTSYQTSVDGVLTLLDKVEVFSGAVVITPYGVDGRGLVVPHFAASGVTYLSHSPSGELEMVQNETFTMDQPGPDPELQEAPHPHDAVLDPTGNFILVPDLGADLVRVFQVDTETLARTPVAPLVAAPGSGPRHGVFKTVLDKTYFYVINEISNTITGYEVMYNEDRTLEFLELFSISTHGEGGTVPEGTFAAEITVTPDGNFLIVSSRNESSLSIPNFDPSNSTEIPSDPLVVFSIDQNTGLLAKVQEFPAGGLFPRHFSVSGDGSLVAVGLQNDGRVVLISRDVETGKLGEFVAHANVEGPVSAVIFAEA